ncbi:hypothetical protein C2S52_001395 [Perilla frutescens var. hirtella]|nr:hypothetical protein C2S52_001395 [Perilla frutescens var. hirtella]
MTSRRDPAWKYGTEIEVSAHLAHKHNNVFACPNVPEEVKNEILSYLNTFQNAKHTAQRNHQEMVDFGSYYGVDATAGSRTGTDGAIPAPDSKIGMMSRSSRGVRGPMDRFVNDKGNDENADGTMTPANAKELRNQVCLDIGRFFYENGIPFNCVRSASFTNMAHSIGNYGRGIKAPTMYELRTWILNEEEKTTVAFVDDIKATWKKTNISLLSDGWSDMRNRSLINFLINNQYGTVFLKTVDTSDYVKDAQKLFELLDGVIEEVGEDIVVQVVTDNAAAYKAAGRLLMDKRKSLYWTPCAAHCIDLMLEKIGQLSQHKNALLKAKKVNNFIHNHQWSMFASQEWSSCAWTKKAEEKDVKKMVMMDKTFWPSVVYSIKTTKPLVHVLRIVDGEKTPAMGFIYGSMDEAKEAIAKNSAYFLNPQYRWSPNVSEHAEIKTGLYKCMERLITDQNIFMKVDEQLDSYKYKKGLFGFKASIQSFMTRPLVIWWDNFGDEVPELKAFATKILGLTCSSSACECNWRKGKSVERGLFDEEDEFEEESGSGSDHVDEPNYDDFDY